MLVRSLSFRVALLALALGSAAYAEKKATVQFTSPALAGALLSGKQVILGTQRGDCSAELAALVLKDVSAQGLPVVSSADVQKAAQRQALSGTALNGDAAWAAAERAFGPLAVVSIEITRCDVRRREPLWGPGLPAIHISRSEGHINGTVRLASVSGRKDVVSIELRAEASKENSGQTVAPEYPGNNEVKEDTLLQALGQARKLYAPWRDSREVSIHDDKACNMSQVVELFQSGQLATVVDAAKQGAENCQPAKSAAHAWYNLGLAYLSQSKFSDAAAAFEKSQKLRESRGAEELLADCRRILAMMALKSDAGAQPAAAAAPSDQPAMILTNEFILKMLRGAVDSDTLVTMIGNNGGRFTLDETALAELKKAGASDALIDAMRKKK